MTRKGVVMRGQVQLTHAKQFDRSIDQEMLSLGSTIAQLTISIDPDKDKACRSHCDFPTVLSSDQLTK